MLLLPYNRPHLFEIHEQPWCPTFIRQHCQAVLTFLWTHRIPPFQLTAPCTAVSNILYHLIREIDNDNDANDPGLRQLKIVDCCSGAGGPMPAIERSVNRTRLAENLPPVQVILSDLHPHLASWAKQVTNSPSAALSFIPESVDATSAPELVNGGRHIRTFCLAFHHFDEDGARRVLEDAMRSSEAVCIFELQEPDFGSILSVLAVFPLTLFVTPFLRPSLLTMFFVYVIPIIPLVMTFDGMISIYRTRSLTHTRHLANLATLVLDLEGKDRGICEEWRWEEGRVTHTRPWGNMFYIIGRKRAVEEDGGYL